jgi:hypothetical protein
MPLRQGLLERLQSMSGDLVDKCPENPPEGLRRGTIPSWEPKTSSSPKPCANKLLAED